MDTDKQIITKLNRKVETLNADVKCLQKEINNIPSGDGLQKVETSEFGNVEFVGDGTEKNPLSARVDLSDYVEKQQGKVLSTNDFSNQCKLKVESVETGAQKNPNFKTINGQPIVGDGNISVQTQVVAEDTQNVSIEGTGTSSSPLKVNVDLSGVVPKESGKGLSSNDFTSGLKSKLESVEQGAQKNPDLKTINGQNIVGNGDIEIDIETADEISPTIEKVVQANAVFEFTTQKITNIAQLRNTIGKEEGQVVELLGYYASGDAPAVKYKWSSNEGTDDGGSCIVITGEGSWNIISSTTIDLLNFGAKPNDLSASVLNFTALVRALNSSLNIAIENSFYITISTSDLTSDYINATSITGRGELINTNSATCFRLPLFKMKKFSITDLIFRSDNGVNKPIYLCVDNTGKEVDEFIFKNNKCYTDVSARIQGNISKDSIVKSINIYNNKYYNTIGTMFIFSDCVCYLGILDGNEVNNMGASFFQATTTNGVVRPYNNINRFEFRNNIVKNDIDYYEKSTSGSYYALAVCEGNESYYYNNIVEGLKSLRNVAVYDIYQSTDRGEYYNNTWKNNASINDTYVDVGVKALYKAKGGVYKKCYNNTFILEESYIDGIIDANSLTIDKRKMAVSYASFNNADGNIFSEFYYHGNEIDVYGLSADSMYTKTFRVCKVYNNTFKFKILTSPLFGVRYDNTGEERVYTCSNNTYHSKVMNDAPQTSFISSSGVSATFTDNVIMNIHDNTFINIIPREYAYSVKVSKLNLYNNAIICEGLTESVDRTNTLLRRCTIGELYTDNNTLQSSGAKIKFRPFVVTDDDNVFVGNYSEKITNPDGVELINLSGIPVIFKNYNYDISVEYKYIVSNGDEYTLDFNVSYVIENDVRKVKFYDVVNSTEQVITINSDDTSSLPNGTTSQIIMNGIGTACTVRIQKFNNKIVLSFLGDNLTSYEFNYKINR